MDKPIPAHQERINEELPIILNAIGRDKYWRQELLFETGCLWLRQQVGESEEYQQLAYQRPFWNWWQLRWEARDFAFNQELRVRNYSAKEARKRYGIYHRLSALCNDNQLIQSFYLILPTLKNRPKNEKRQKTRAA